MSIYVNDIRPCDICSMRRVRCGLKRPCDNCISHGVSCTNNRIRGKKGPRGLRKKTLEQINQEKIHSLQNFNQSLIRVFMIYKKHYYCLWPVIGVDNLLERFVNESKKTLCRENAATLALSYALCAAVINNSLLLKFDKSAFTYLLSLDSSDFLKMAWDAKMIMDSEDTTCLDSILTSFFLNETFAKIGTGYIKSLLHLREAVTKLLLLNVSNLDKFDLMCYKTIYCLLFVTERYYNIKFHVPSLLPWPPSITLGIDSEDISSKCGLLQLVMVFDAIDSQNVLAMNMPFLKCDHNTKRQLIEFEKKLIGIDLLEELPMSQKVNIIVSRHWMRNIFRKQVMETGKAYEKDYYLYINQIFPFEIVHDLLTEFSGLDLNEFFVKSVCVKVLEIADSLAICLNYPLSGEYSFLNYIGKNHLYCMLKFILNTNVTLSLPESMSKSLKELFFTAVPNSIQMTPNKYIEDSLEALVILEEGEKQY